MKSPAQPGDPTALSLGQLLKEVPRAKATR